MKHSIISAVYGNCAGYPVENRVTVDQAEDGDMYDNSVELVRAVMQKEYPDCIINVVEEEYEVPNI